MKKALPKGKAKERAGTSTTTEAEPEEASALWYTPALYLFDRNVQLNPGNRQYQNDMIATVMRMYEQDDTQCLTVQCPTGGGKTRISTQLIAAMRKNAKILYVVPSTEIFEQTCDKLKEAGQAFATLAAGENPDLNGVRVLVAMSQTLARRKKSPVWNKWRPDVVIIDEIHKLISQHRGVARWFKAPIIGLTATPCRLDGQDLSDLTPYLVLGPEVAELQREGHLVRDVVCRAPAPALGHVKVVRGDYDQEGLERAYLEQNIYKVVPEFWHLKAKGKRTITFAPGVNASKKLVEAYRKAGIRARHVDGSTPRHVREAALEELRRHTIDVLVNVGLYVEGLDLVEVECVTMCQPTKSVSRYMQQIGRGLRPAPHIGKDRLIVIDHAGNTRQHGRVSKHRDWQQGGLCSPEDLLNMHVCKYCGMVGEQPDQCDYCGFGKVTLPAVPKEDVEVAVNTSVQLRGVAWHRAEKERSRATAVRVCPQWARQCRALWYRLERERVAEGYPLPSHFGEGYVESRCRHYLHSSGKDPAKAA